MIAGSTSCTSPPWRTLPRWLEGAAFAVGGPRKDAESHGLILELTSGKRTPRHMLFEGERLKIDPKIQEKWDREVHPVLPG